MKKFALAFAAVAALGLALPVTAAQAQDKVVIKKHTPVKKKVVIHKHHPANKKVIIKKNEG